VSALPNGAAGRPETPVYLLGSRSGRRPPAGPAEGRVALVSGGDQGLGLRIVRMLAERGMRVVLGCRSVDSGRAAAAALGSLAGRVAVRELDLTDEAGVRRLVSWMELQLRRCDVLVNNATVLFDDDGHVPTGIDLAVVRRTLDNNLFGAWHLTQSVAPLMRAGRYGRVVNISSDLASLTSMRCDLPAYRISKCALNALTRMLADELAGEGVLVNACCREPAPPGDTDAAVSATADTATWLATLPDDGPTGGFFRGRTPVGW
jgi:NAD(P)-dependent dehydrogenase (short-subunit alcohol dehydrogenase family)